MTKASELNPKFYQELIDRIRNGQPYEDMFSKHDPYAIRDIAEESLGEFTKGKHPYDLYERPELLKSVPINEVPDMSEHGVAKFFRDKRTKTPILEEPMSISLRNRNDRGTLLHETQHIYDLKTQPNIIQLDEMPDKNILSNIKKELDIKRPVKSLSDLRGVEEATEYLNPHFKPDVDKSKLGKLKQFVNLERAVKGLPLKSIAPLLKATGIGALGYQAMGIGNKAMAGDFGAAGMETLDLATDLAPGIGEVKDAIRPTEMGNSELPKEEMEKRIRFNKLKQRLGN